LAAGRPLDSVRLLLAVKTQSAAAIRAALEGGAYLIGQNRVQEMTSTEPLLAGLPHATHMIGQLQSNKVNQVLRWADCIQTVDSLKLAERLAARVSTRLEVQPGPEAGSGRKPPSDRLDVMVQVNTSGEATKAGVEPALALDLMYAVAALAELRLTGLMTVGLNSSDSAAIGRAYAALRDLRDQAATSGKPGTEEITELSMGMSGDLEIAIAEGATMVRLGTAVFGARPSA
jgi:pyridoxal phosphate enzyme (YggS family)